MANILEKLEAEGVPVDEFSDDELAEMLAERFVAALFKAAGLPLPEEKTE